MKVVIRFNLILIALLFMSCGSSISKDAQKVADLQCEVVELQKKAFSGDASDREDLQEYIAEAAALVKKMNAKYDSFEEKQEFSKALLNAQANCN